MLVAMLVKGGMQTMAFLTVGREESDTQGPQHKRLLFIMTSR